MSHGVLISINLVVLERYTADVHLRDLKFDHATFWD